MTRAGDRREAPGLPEAIAVGLRALRDLTRPPVGVTSGDLERLLRAAAARHETSCRRHAGDTDVARPIESAAVAVRAACAHLSAGDLADTYLALRAARDALPRELRQAPPVEDQHTPSDTGSRRDPDGNRADSVAETQRRALDDRAGLDQAIGIVAQHADASVDEALALLRAHAERHQCVLAGLAADVVAGRVDAAVIAGTRADATAGAVTRSV